MEQSGANNLVSQWQRIPLPQKVTLVAVLALIILVAVVVLKWSSSPDYVTLYSNLDPATLSKITSELSSDGIPYKLTPDGSGVKVGQAFVGKARMALGAKGLGENKHGFELFDKPNFAVSQFAEKVNYQRALEGELSDTIKQLECVRSAVVHIVMPDDSPFVTETQAPSCSVLVDLVPGKGITPAQVNGIVNLVCYSIRGLTPERVSVVDGSGNVLSTELHASPELGVASSKLILQRRFEQELAAKLETMLDKLVGQGNAVVRVSAKLNFDQVQQVSNLVKPVNGGRGIQVKSEYTEETQSGNGPLAAGVPGTTSNRPGAGAAASGTAGTYKRTEESNQYEVSRITETTAKAPGEIEKLTVAVLINDSALTQAKRSSLEQAIITAAGLDLSRGDKVTVSGVAFAKNEPKPKESAPLLTSKVAYLQQGMHFLPLVLALFVLLMVFKLVKTFTQRELQSSGEVRATPPAGATASFAQSGESEAEASSASQRKGLRLVERGSAKSEVELAKDEELEKAKAIATEYQERAVAVLRTWLME